MTGEQAAAALAMLARRAAVAALRRRPAPAVSSWPWRCVRCLSAAASELAVRPGQRQPAAPLGLGLVSEAVGEIEDALRHGDL